MIRVLFVPNGDVTTASSRYRVYEMTQYFANIDATILSPEEVMTPFPREIERGYIASKLLYYAPKFDVVYLQKVRLPTVYLKLLNTLAICVYDFDDPPYATPPWHSVASPTQLEPTINTLNHVDAAITGNPLLSEFAAEYVSLTFTLPPAVNQPSYEKVKSSEMQSNNDSVILGWIGNPENLWYLSNVEDIISEILDKYDKALLHIITDISSTEGPLQHRDDVLYKQWSLEDELEMLSRFDIGIRPLTDDKYTRSKGGFISVTQMMALGIPVVASPVSMLTEFIEPGANGYLASTREEWIRYLQLLIENSEHREKIGKNAYESLTINGLWADIRAEKLESILEEISNGN